MAPRNQFPSRGSLDSATDAFSIAPSDSVDLVDIPRAIWVGTGGNIALAMTSGNVTLLNVPDGTLLPVRPSRVRVTGTTASNMVGLL
ncbi:hypothetical protein G6L74_06180 [Agrobacterium tumefaciens]|uniref:spike base protein, RCAP_Rcc01079 family n=1 Tax=Agrobacterium tumefaciens TaxID=358 RepID=UPI00157171B4|nr:hypothetical protein [Agrobacterium tumefaciens]